MADGVFGRDLATYFDEARSWDQERIRGAIRSRRIAYIVAGAASAIAVVSIGAVAALTPLKTVAPYVVTVDRNTGSAEVTTALTGRESVPYEEAVTKYFVAQYVRFREGWVPRARRDYFNSVAIMSTPDEQRRWAAFYRNDNPLSPQVVYAEAGSVGVEMNAITFVNANVAQVRFVKEIVAGTTVTRTSWIATMTFDYSRAPLSESDRLMNPLGFQVSTYRADPEVTQAPVTVPVQASPVVISAPSTPNAVSSGGQPATREVGR
ncbi:virB8 family protein [Sphingomonas sp. PB2P19]|uniref:virB8 family protein n=1 Tax=Sphingomonas rhamnosi TaxID=3096156 RepID=UPI002FC5A247